MIDYIDAVVPMKHEDVIRNGFKTITKKDGSTSESNYPIRIFGRNGSSIQVQSVDNEHIRIIGNLAMFIQGQNVYGTDNLLRLGCKAFAEIAELLGVKPTKENRRQWRAGDFQVNTLDVTYNFNLGSQPNVRNWLNQAAVSLGSGKQVIEMYRSYGTPDIESIYLGKKSTFISVKFYNKYLQLSRGAKNRRKIKEGGPILKELVDSTKGLLRCEIRFHKLYLKKYELTMARDLDPKILRKHFYGKLKKIHIGPSTILPVEDIQGLTPLSHRLAYQLWIKGGDVKHEMAESTFLRAHKKLLTFGVDIGTPFVEGVCGSTLRSYLVRSNVAVVPDFLVGTPWYYKPGSGKNVHANASQQTLSS
ncbi:MAG: phage/plasmid replication protein, II/X family [Bacteroidales bacterium]|nr:phage/plasmid replication protein, II/X family [Bacteroidales bacterium]